MHPILQKYRDKHLKRMAQRFRTGYTPQDSKHRQLQTAWVLIGNFKGHSTTGFFVIRYCPECKFGTVIDLVFEKPKGENARDLGIINKREWSSLCPERKSNDQKS